MNKDLLKHMQVCQCYVVAWVGGEFGGRIRYMYMWLEYSSSPESITMLLAVYPNAK